MYESGFFPDLIKLGMGKEKETEGQFVREKIEFRVINRIMNRYKSIELSPRRSFR